MIGSDNAILNIARAMITHAAARQAAAAENLAQADTPGYRAKDVAAFADAFANGELTKVAVDRQAPVKPNGNSVGLEAQVMNLAEAKGQHELALGIWQQTANLYQIALGRAR